MRILPKSLVGQTVLVLLAGLTISHILSMAIYSTDRAQTLLIASEQQMAHRMGEITRLLNETPVEWRKQIVHVVDNPQMRVSLTDIRAVDREQNGTWQESLIRTLLSTVAGLGKGGDIFVEISEPARNGSSAEAASALTWMHSHMMWMMAGTPPDHSLKVSIRLEDGQWVNFATGLRGAATGLWSYRSVLSTALMTAAIAVMSFWVVRRMTRPLRALSKASERLGRDVTAPALKEQGPTEVIQAVRAFNEMQQNLQRLIENRTRMLAAISHDLRTPITLLRIRAEYISDEDEKQKTLSTLDDMEAMIASTLAFAREDAKHEERRVVDISALVQSLCDDLADAGLAVSFETADSIKLPCRPLALKRAIGNVIENAVKYGKVADVHLTPCDKTVTLTIDDQGPGIPSEEIQNVFQPFYRLEHSRSRETGGVGLGLSVSRSIIHAHGGDIVVTNRPEGGLRATVHLPL